MIEVAPVPARELVSWIPRFLAKRRESKSLELKVRDGGRTHWWELEILNSGKLPIVINTVDWSVGQGKNLRSFDGVTIRDGRVLPNGTFRKNFSPYGVFPGNVQKYSRGQDVETLRFRVHTDLGVIKSLHPGERLIDCLRENLAA